MDITPLIPTSYKILQRYGDGTFTVNKETFTDTILITPQEVTPLPYRSADAIVWEKLPLPDSLELLLIGGGSAPIPLSPSIRQHFRQRSLAVDTMDTGAACRTYNVLLAEGRNVGALLLPVY